MCRRLGERGYTFIEAFLQLFVLLLFAQLIFFIIQIFSTIQSFEERVYNIDYELFVYDLNQYLYNAIDFKAMNSGQALEITWLFEGEPKKYIIDKSEKHIRKTTAAGGNEVMLANVDEIKFSIRGHELNLQMVLKNGNKRERLFIVPITKE